MSQMLVYRLLMLDRNCTASANGKKDVMGGVQVGTNCWNSDVTGKHILDILALSGLQLLVFICKMGHMTIDYKGEKTSRESEWTRTASVKRI